MKPATSGDRRVATRSAPPVLVGLYSCPSDEEESGTEEEPQGPAVAAEIHSDDRIYEVTFDARCWFAQATDEQILVLAEEDWGPGYASDEVGRSMADFDRKIAKLFDYLEHLRDVPSKRDESGFCVTINEDQAMAWLDSQKPELAKKIQGKDRG